MTKIEIEIENKENEVKLSLLTAMELSIKSLQRSHDDTYLSELAGYSVAYAAINKSLLVSNQ